MDEYTTNTRAWLEERFRLVEVAGRYRAHQPVYGFSASRESGLLVDYLRLYHVFRALGFLRFSSFLDVGGSEGMLGHLVGFHFGSLALTTDLSRQACLRARELFQSVSVPSDAHDLPFRTESVDVVACTETLEHVTDPSRVVAELIRVARRAVLITVPKESLAVVESNRVGTEPHSHIHNFTLPDVRRLFPPGMLLRCEPIMSPGSALPLALIEARPLGVAARKRLGHGATFYDVIRPTLRALLGPRTAGTVIRLDRFLSRLGGYGGVLCVAIKDPSCVSQRAASPIAPEDLFSLIASPLYLRDGIPAQG